MALGYCTACDQLKPITKVGLKLGSRECEWAPIHHDAPDTHGGCGATVHWSETALEDSRQLTYVAECDVCGPISPDDVIPGVGHCKGSRKPIR